MFQWQYEVVYGMLFLFMLENQAMQKLRLRVMYCIMANTFRRRRLLKNMVLISSHDAILLLATNGGLGTNGVICIYHRFEHALLA